MKKSMKIIYVFLCFIIAFSPFILASGSVSSIDGITVTPDTSNTGFEGAGKSILGIIKVIGVFVSVGALMAIGIKYMMGSAEEKAEYKKVMIPYIIGAILLFAAAVFADKIATFAGGLFS